MPATPHPKPVHVQAAVDRYEAETRNAARAKLGTEVARIQAQFRADITHARAVGDDGLIEDARKRAAGALRALRPQVAPILRHAVAEGIHLGAAVAGTTPPDGIRPFQDPAIRETLARVNTPIRRHARLSASAVERLPLNTDRQIEQVIDRIGAVITEVDAAAGVVTSRAVAIGTQAACDDQGVGRIWVTQDNCCPLCAEYSGAFAPPGHGFAPRSDFGAGPDQWGQGGDAEPPLHNHCKCHGLPYARGLGDKLARKTQEDAAAGRLAASTPARVKAIENMLASDAKLTQRTRQRAATAAARGRFTGQRPETTRRASA